MKKLLLTPIALFTLIISAMTQSPQSAIAGGIGNNYIAPSVTFNSGTSIFGIDGKIGVADNLSLRPFVTFPSGGNTYGASLTYDWDLRQATLPITPFLGLGVEFDTVNNKTNTNGFAQVGADLTVSDSLALLGSLGIPFNGGNTSITLGAGFRF